jgi:hypothetical protein
MYIYVVLVLCTTSSGEERKQDIYSDSHYSNVFQDFLFYRINEILIIKKMTHFSPNSMYLNLNRHYLYSILPALQKDVYGM